MPRVPGHNPYPSSDGNQDLMAATALSESNSTAAHFLGTAQKPWMNGNNYTLNLRNKTGNLPTNGRNLPQTLGSIPSGARPAISQANSITVSGQGSLVPFHSTHPNPTISAGFSAPSPVLPSPAPSECMGDGQTDDQGYLTILSNAPVEEPGPANAVTISPAQTIAPIRFTSTQGAETPGSPATYAQEQMNHGVPGGRKRSTDNVLAEWSKRARSVHPPNTPSNDPGQNLQPQPLSTSHSPQGSSVISPVSEVRLSSLITKVYEFIQSKLNTTPPLNALDRQRCKLLEEACSSNDLFYVCVHKLCCSARMAEIMGCSTPSLEPGHLEGMRILEILIRSNSDLSMDALAFFSEFPTEFTETQSEMHRRTFEKARTFLLRLSNYWDRYRKTCEKRRYPLFVDEMVVVFQLTSRLLQSILFRSIHRHITMPDDQSLNERVDRLLEADQKAFSNRKPRPHVLSSQQIQIESQRLGQRYQHIVNTWATERQKQVEQFPNHSSGSFPPDAAGNIFVQPSSNLRENSNVHPSHLNYNRSNQSSRSSSFQGFSNIDSSLNSRSNSYSDAVSLNSALNCPSAGQAYGQINQSITSNTPPPSRSNVMHAGLQRLPAVRNRPRSFLPGPPNGAVQARPSSPPNSILDAHTMSFPFLDRQGFSISVPPTPPDRTMLQQSDQKISRYQKLDRNGIKDSSLRLYQYFELFKIPVAHLGNTQASFTFNFTVFPSEWDRKVADIQASPGDSGRTRSYSHGKLLYRLKCVQYPPKAHELIEKQWIIKGQCWPKTCFVEINGHHPEIPRRDSHGKDLPLDLTGYLTPGTNFLEFSLIRDGDESVGGNKLYAVAVEAIAIGDEKGVREQIARLKMEASLASITKALQSQQDDEDLTILDPDLSVDVVDPFSATIFKTPTRGMHCLHRECFDLDNFLQTRKSSRTGAPTGADEWKCPICGADSRPSKLVVDEFLLHVRKALEENGELDAKAILIKADGSWKVRTECQTENQRPGAETETEDRLQSAEGWPAPREKDDVQAVVIDIDED